MENKKGKTKLILIISLLGIIGVLITIISDFILIGKPTSAFTFLRVGPESMWDISASRITAGAFIGVMALPFQLLGLAPVYFALKPAGKVLPAMAVIINAHALLMGVAFHISYVYIGSSWTLHHQAAATLVTEKLVDQFSSYWMILSIIMFTEILVSSMIYILIILKGNSLFPKWMAMFSHLGVVVFTLLIVVVIPAPFGGYVGSACLNLATMIFFLLTLIVGYKRIKAQELLSEKL